jgi:hypothetical protein
MNIPLLPTLQATYMESHLVVSIPGFQDPGIPGQKISILVNTS